MTHENTLRLDPNAPRSAPLLRPVPISPATLRMAKRALLLQALRLEACYESARQARLGRPATVSMLADRKAIAECVAALSELRALG